ncbi:unnamed protein product [Prorocentrum cordatum]|uniref:Uncharacterized protein n=1 Tax=Prorocentrum cordatum TaxID=2364126 RepID=A0ABN9X483_9DINO|nr:unnamed protein product [Polarella glacialis]
MERAPLEIRAVVKAYVSKVAPSASAFDFLILVPRNFQDKLANVLAPEAGHGGMSVGRITQMVDQHEAVVIPPVYKTKEHGDLTRVLGHLRAAHPDTFVFLVQLPHRFGTKLTRATSVH